MVATTPEPAATATPEREITQERRLVGPLPGPRSQELGRRRIAAVAPGVSSTLPVYIERASGRSSSTSTATS